MIPASFDYHAPTTLADALRLLGRDRGDAKIMAGGHSLTPMMKLRLARPGSVIDLRRVPGLNYIREEDGHLAIGAMTTYWDIMSSELVQQKRPGLAATAAEVADIQVRNKGTIGGSLSHADPAGDMPAAVLALEAEMHSRSSRATRATPAERFFVDTFVTRLRDNEILTEIRIPVAPARTGESYKKFANKASHFAIVGVTAIVTLSGNTCQRVRIGVTGAGANANRARAVEAALEGKDATDDNIARAAAQAGEGIDFLGDIHASEEFRAHLVQVFARRALQEAVARAR
jgi:carbon-monoxide dehydrogenase medium subunit